MVNMATENVIAYLSEKDRLEGIDLEEFGIAMQMAERIFPTLWSAYILNIVQDFHEFHRIKEFKLTEIW